MPHITVGHYEDHGSGQRVALVTQGSGEIGRSVAERLASDGHAVAMLYSGDGFRALEAAAKITAAGGTTIVLKGDVADERSMVDVFDRISEHFGGVDVVVNTVGITLLGPVASFDLADLDRMYRVNIRGNYVVSQLASNRVRPGGAIINFSTSVSQLQQPGCGAFAASSGAINAMTLVLANELGSRDVTVNAVVPSETATAAETPAEIANVVSFLAGPGHWVSGQILHAREENLSGSRLHATIAGD